MPKITFIGAGSTVFAKRLLVDILNFPELADATISLHDIDEDRLRTSEIVAHKVAQALDAHPTIEATTDRRASLDGADYVPWFIKRDRPNLIERFSIPLDEYPRRCELQIAGWEALREYLEDPKTTIAVERTYEYGSYIIHSLETGTPRIIYGNVSNRGLIDNLPPDCIVEVPCVVDKNGIQPTRIGALPPHLAALMQTNTNVQALTVEAALTKKREYIYHAAMLDPPYRGRSRPGLDLEPGGRANRGP